MKEINLLSFSNWGGICGLQGNCGQKPGGIIDRGCGTEPSR